MLLNLQVLRGFAALLVVAVHIDGQYMKLGIPHFGGFGVDIFFVISGFIMVYTTRDRDISPATFLIDRIVRIVPMYWLMTLMVFLGTLYAPFLFNKTFLDVTLLLKSLLFIPTMRSTGLIQPLLYVGWSLNYEMFFYVLFAIGLAFHRYATGLMLTTTAIIFLTFLSIFGPYENAIYEFYTHPMMLEFICGMGLGYFITSLTKNRDHRLTPALIFVCLTSLLIGTTAHLLFPEMKLFFVIIAATLAVYSAIHLEALGVKITAKIPIAIGSASYSIYLTHPFVAGAMNKLSNKFGTTVFANITCVLISYVVIAIVGYLFYFIVERNCNYWLKTQRKRFSQSSVVA